MHKNIRPGKLVYWRNMPAIVLELKGFSEAILRLVDDPKTEIAHITDLTSGPISEDESTSHHLLAKDMDWNTAVARFEAIRPLLENNSRQAMDVESVAANLGKSAATIYRWLARFEETGLVSSLLRTPRSDRGNFRLTNEVEKIIDKKIESDYLKKERPSVMKLYRSITEECDELGVEAPNRNTVYARVGAIEREKVVAKRYGPKRAKNLLAPLRGAFPPAEFPNAVVQIDHTKVDVIVVDEMHRLPIGRPYLTLSIDVATKMVTGFVLTLDPPGALSTGLCISHAVSRKEFWLAKRDIDAEWPIFGKMVKIHVDNAKEFRGLMLNRACEQHGIIIEYRPVGQPNYGPHIERAFRTFMQECQTLPGTTFSNVAKKLDYDSEGRACMTLKELELWLTNFIVCCYHHRKHTGVTKIPPIKAYYEFVHGSATRTGVGMPAPIEDEEKFRLDFTPYVTRSVRRDGVVIDHIQYYAPILRKWIEAPDPGDRSKKRKFIFARDPRDISSICFLDPDTQSYCRIPYFNSARPAISVWELEATIKRLQEDPANIVDEDMIFKGIRKMRDIEEAAIEKTRLAKQSRANEKRKRRMNERRKGWQNVHGTDQTDTKEKNSADFEIVLDEVDAFTDIQIG